MATRSRRKVISATEAAKNFGALIERVRSERAEYVVERGGTAAVVVSPAGSPRCSGADLVELVRSHTRPDEEYLKAVESGVAALNKPSVPKNPWRR